MKIAVLVVLGLVVFAVGASGAVWYQAQSDILAHGVMDGG